HFKDLTGHKLEDLIGKKNMETAFAIFRPGYKAPAGTNVVRYMVDGKPKFMQVHKDLWEALEGTSPTEANFFVKILAKVGNIMRFNTIMEPGYAVYNFARDTASRGVNSSIEKLNPFDQTVDSLAEVTARAIYYLNRKNG